MNDAPFTEREDARIRTGYKKEGASRLARKLNRSPQALWNRAVQLGVITAVHPQAFTDADLELIRRHYHDWGAKRVADAMGRSPGSVRNKAIKMGVAQPETPLPDLTDLGPAEACPECGACAWIAEPNGRTVCGGVDADGNPCEWNRDRLGLCPSPDQIAEATVRILGFRPPEEDEPDGPGSDTATAARPFDDADERYSHLLSELLA